jgi:hypothetical protein
MLYIAAIFAGFPNAWAVSEWGGDVRQLMRLGRRAEALALVSRNGPEREIIARSFLKNETFQFYQEGVNWLEQREWKKAAVKFRRALEIESDHVDLLLRLSQSLLMERNGPAAAEESKVLLGRALASIPEDPQTMLWLARAHLDLEEWDLALVVLKKVEAARPQWEWSSVWIAEAMTRKGENPNRYLMEVMRKYPLRLSALVVLNRQKTDRRFTHRWLLSRWDAYDALLKNPSKRAEVLGPLGVEYETASDLKVRWQAQLAASSTNPVGRVE